MNNMTEYVDIPYGNNLENFRKAISGIGMTYKVRKREGMVRVYYDAPIGLFWLGCNLVAMSAGIFESALTTHAFNAKT